MIHVVDYIIILGIIVYYEGDVTVLPLATFFPELTIAEYQPGLSSPTLFLFFTTPTHLLHLSSHTHHREVREAYQRRIQSASTSERRRKVLPLLDDFLSPCKSPAGRILGGFSLQTALTKPI